MNYHENTTDGTASGKKSNFFVKFISTALTVVLATTAGYIARTGTRTLMTNAQANRSKPARIEFQPRDEAKETVNPEFDALLKEWNITYEEQISASESEVFAHEAEDGVLEIIEVGHKNDIVREMVNVMYVDVTPYSEVDRMTILENIRQMCVTYGNYRFVTADLQEVGNYFCLTLRMKNLDQPENIAGLAELGLANPGTQELLMSITANNFQDLGYTRK